LSPENKPWTTWLFLGGRGAGKTRAGAQWVRDVAAADSKARIALVGHEPGIGALAARLIGSRQALVFKKGAIARIDVPALPPAGAGTLRWLVTPRLLRRLAR